MFTNWMLGCILKADCDFENPATRRKVGYLAGFVGVVINLILTIIKITIPVAAKT